MILDRKIAPPSFPLQSVPALNPKKARIADQLDVYLLEGGTQDVVKIDLLFKAGTRHETKALSAVTCGNMLKEGTTEYNADAISEMVDFYGAQIGVDVSQDFTEISLLCLGKYLPQLIDIFVEVLIAPVFPGEELALVKSRSKSALAVNLDKVGFQCRLLFSSLLFPDSPYQERFRSEDFDLLERQDLASFYKKNYNLDRAVCVISGTNTERASELLQTALLKRSDHFNISGNLTAAPDWEYEPGEAFKEKSGSVQTAIRIGLKAIDRQDENYPALYLANIALGGYFGSRLMQNLRENRGFTYGISSKLNHYRHASYLSISTEVGAKDTYAAIDEIKKEMVNLGQIKMSQTELDLIKNYVAGSLIKNFDGPFAIAERVKVILRAGLENTYYEDFSSQLMALTTTDVKSAAEHYLDISQISVAAVGAVA